MSAINPGSDPAIQGGVQSGVERHDEVVLNETWWWAVCICLSAIALFANLLFIVTIIYNRKRQDLKTFVTAIIITIAVLDIVDVARIVPILVESLFDNEIFRHVYCTLRVFHELAVAIFLVSMAIGVCVQAGKTETKYYAGGADPRASLAQKILIPVVLLVAAGIATPLFLLSYSKLAFGCVDPFRITKVLDTESPNFYSDLYATIVTALTYLLPILIMPLAIPVACLRTCISRQCCVPRFKQPIGELIMTAVVCIIYLGTVVGIVLPRLDQMIEMEKVVLEPIPVLWELGNNAIRPLAYFMTNPGVWDGLGTLCGCCCRKKHTLVNSDDMEEAEIPLSPVTTV